MYPSIYDLREDNRFFIVCDGMGGHEKGEVATTTRFVIDGKIALWGMCDQYKRPEEPFVPAALVYPSTQEESLQAKAQKTVQEILTKIGFCQGPCNVEYLVDKQGQVTSHETQCALNYIGTLHNQHAASFKRHFAYPFHEVKRFATQKIGVLLNRVDVTDAYFGSSAYIDLIQSLQLKVSGADISFSAPLFFNASIEAGDIKVSNLFDLYRFEDHLYTLHLTGEEIKHYLEMSYAAWTQQMHAPTDPMLLISPMKSNPERMGFKNFIFNFDSAAGFQYEVDVTKPEGEKVRIFTMDDGRPFRMEDTYTVAMTAYRANGGGELLTKGAGLS